MLTFIKYNNISIVVLAIEQLMQFCSHTLFKLYVYLFVTIYTIPLGKALLKETKCTVHFKQ